MTNPGMKSMGKAGRSASAARTALITLTAVLAVSLMLFPVAASATVSDKPALEGDAKCMKCHSKNLKKKLEDGERLSLHVAQSDFEESVHGTIGCTGCHTSIAGKKHPSKQPISSKRSYSLEQNESCRNCHEKKFTQYEGSIHASLVAGGSDIAPSCTDCHSAHAVQSMASYEPVTGQPCKACHEGVYTAYAQSVHGIARTEGNVIRDAHIQAPICSDCHQAHEVAAVAAADQLHTACLGCHEGAETAHTKWLPNASLHLDVVSCAACHSPEAERRIDLELYDELAEVPVGQHENHAGMDDKMRAIDASEDGLGPMELWKLVRETSQEGGAVDVTLKGRMKVRSGVDAHHLAVKTSAVRNCDNCHQGDSEAFQNVTVSISRPDGRKQYFDADKEVLSSVASVDTVRGFYAMGGTRIKMLDGLLLLGIIGGLAIPIGHITLGKLLKKKQ
jgi:nitrate/TMAO reductase-like tetraheme cytochrome c subunit